MIEEAIKKIVTKQNLTYKEAYSVMDEIMGGNASSIQISSYLTALAMKGETVEEITASAQAMRDHGTKLIHNTKALEIVGTGGDGASTFNISTTSAFVIAAGGVNVAKHGNRAASSKSGAADVLEALGANIAVSPEKSAYLLQNLGICFLFAQEYHTAMKYVASVRKELGIRTVFNILGPLSNPACAEMELMGVYDIRLVRPLAQVLSNLGVKRGMVVYGKDKLDEISASSPTAVCEIKDGRFYDYEISPEDFGFESCGKAELKGGTAAENAQITLNILSGKERGAKRTAVELNSGAALYIAGKAKDIKGGVALARKLIDDGSAINKLNDFIKLTNCS